MQKTKEQMIERLIDFGIDSIHQDWPELLIKCYMVNHQNTCFVDRLREFISNEMEIFKKWQAFRCVIQEIIKNINELANKNPDLATYIKKNIIFDSENMTVQYTGDDCVEIKEVFYGVCR